ncbi:MAG TPA: Rv3235 family protein [Pseudonocardiaceae bacterium]
MTTSIAEPAQPLSHHPVLRRLVDVLPPEVPAIVASAPIPARPATDHTTGAHAERVLRAAVEILGGRRPVHQLAAVLRPELLAHLTTLQEAMGHLRPRVLKVIASPQGPGVTEAVAVVRLSTGIRALAARFEERIDGGGHRWQCTALQLRLTSGDLATREHPQRATR